jgi:hypothetical protein
LKGLSRVQGNCAPRNARLNLWRSQKKLGEMLLGHPIYLKMKVGGEKSISEKRESLEDAEGVVLRGPCDMAKAKLPESQSPVVETACSSLQRLRAMLPGAYRPTFAVRNLRPADDEQRVH